MKIWFTTIGSLGDYIPLVAVARELAARGHDVAFAGNAYFASVVEREGIPFTPLTDADAYRQAMQADWSGWSGVRNWTAAVQQAMPPMLDWLANECRPGDVVVGTGWCFAARMIRELLDVRLVTVHLQPDAFLTTADLPVWRRSLRRLVYSTGGDLVLGRAINALCKRYHLPPARGILTEWWHSPDLVLALFPPWLEARAVDWPANTVMTGFARLSPTEDHLDDACRAFLRGGEPPLVFSRPSWRVEDDHFYHAALQASRRMGRRAIMIGVTEEAIGIQQPDDVLFLAFAPLELLLPHAAAFVHHGGIGSSAEAIAAGIPQLIVPATSEQRSNGQRLCRLQLAEMITQTHYDATALTQALVRMHRSQAMAAACRTYAEKCRQNGAALAADHIEALRHPAPARTGRCTPDSAPP